MVLSIAEIKEIITNFLSKHSNKLECKVYEYEEKIHREGEQTPKIYIIKEGVFRIGKLDTPVSNTTLGFCFESQVIIPMQSIHNDYISLFELKSIENNISNCNSVYEIPLEQWKSFVEKDETLETLPMSVLHNNLSKLFNLLTTLRQNRKTEELFSKMYNEEHPILNSGINEKYIAEYFGVSISFLRQMFTNARLNKKITKKTKK